MQYCIPYSKPGRGGCGSFQPKSFNSMDKFPLPVTKSIRVFRFDPHPRRKQLTIVGEVSITVAGNGKLIRQFSEPFKKSVKLIGLTPSSRVSSIVNDVFQSCAFLESTPTLRASLDEAIDELARREYDANGNAISTRRAADGSYLPRYLDVFDEVECSQVSSRSFISEEKVEEADICKLNQYVEMLYEDIPSKIEGVRLISQLTKSNRYLVIVSEHASAANAIFRTLREDNRKNMNLTLHIFSICWDFAKLHCFHRFLVRHKLPTQILNILDHELERCEKWKLLVQKREDVARRESTPKAVGDYISANESFQSHVHLQNCILRLGFDILHFLSEDRIVASGLLHQGVVTSLNDALDRSDFSIWECVLAYLKDMSVYKEYVEQMINVDTLGKLTKILKSKTAIPVKVARICFGLLCNLSFNSYLRHEMVNRGLLTVFAKCLSKSSFADIIAKTLYLISLDIPSRSKIVKTGVAEITLGHLTPNCCADSPDKVSRIKGALAANLAKDPKGAKVLGESMRMSVLVKQSIKCQDVMGMKIVRNVVETKPSNIVDHQAGHIAKAVVEVNSLDFVLECIGILGNLSVDQVNFPDLLKRNRLVVWLKRQLMNYMNMTDIVQITFQLKNAALEVIMLLANICRKEDGARFVVGEGFVDQILIRLIHERHADPHIIQEIVYLFNICCHHEPVAAFLVTKTQFPHELMAFALRIGGQLRYQCEKTLHKLAEFDESWRETMTEHEFLIYNENWITAVSKEEKREQSAPHQIPRPCQSNHEIFQNLMKGTRFTYDFAGIDDEDECITRPGSCSNDVFDDSTTDEDSIFCSFSQDISNSSSIETGRKPVLNKTLSFYESYWKEFEKEMAHSRDWQFFLQ